MRISDWSSDVCSSDLTGAADGELAAGVLSGRVSGSGAATGTAAIGADAIGTEAGADFSGAVLSIPVRSWRHGRLSRVTMSLAVAERISSRRCALSCRYSGRVR